MTKRPVGRPKKLDEAFTILIIFAFLTVTDQVDMTALKGLFANAVGGAEGFARLKQEPEFREAMVRLQESGYRIPEDCEV